MTVLSSIIFAVLSWDDDANQATTKMQTWHFMEILLLFMPYMLLYTYIYMTTNIFFYPLSLSLSPYSWPITNDSLLLLIVDHWDYCYLSFFLCKRGKKEIRSPKSEHRDNNLQNSFFVDCKQTKNKNSGFFPFFLFYNSIGCRYKQIHAKRKQNIKISFFLFLMYLGCSSRHLFKNDGKKYWKIFVFWHRQLNWVSRDP